MLVVGINLRSNGVRYDKYFMWWSKPKYTVEELERSYVLEERTRVQKERIAQMNKLIDRDPTKEAKIPS